MTPPDFPLMKLPYLGQRHVVWTMTTEEKIFYSLLSQNAKKLITGLHQTSDFLEIILTNQQIRIHSSFSPSYLLEIRLIPEDLTEPWPRPLPLSMEYAEASETVLGHYTTTRQWIDHLSEIFHTKKLKIFFLGGSEVYELDSIKERFQGYEIIGVRTLNISKEDTQNVLRTFQSIKEISWDRDPFEEDDTEGFEGVIRQKLDYFNFGHDIRGGLDTLMIMDCATVEIQNSYLETSDFNRFIKNWINTNNYKNLKTLTVAVTVPRIGMNYQQKILNDIPHQVVPKEEYKTFDMPNPSHLWEYVTEIVGQFEIQKENGMKATIQMDRYVKCIRFKFIVGK